VKTIVTGGAGFIGSHLVDRLLAEGGEVIVVDNFDPFYDRACKERNLIEARHHPRFRLVELDIRDARTTQALAEETRPDVIVHLAARAGVRPSIADPRLYTEVNVLGTLSWLEAASRLKPRPRFVYASSSSVYGDRVAGPFRESDPVDLPVSPYAASKRACELLAHTFHHLHGLPVTGLRLFTAYGPRNRPDLAIAKFTRLIDMGLPVPMFGDGTSRRDYTYVDDIVDGIVRAIERCSGHHLYNLGNSQPVALGDVIDFGKERARLEKELKKAEDEISRFDAKLSNQQFISRAPKDVLNEQREKRGEAAALAIRLREAVNRLSV